MIVVTRANGHVLAIRVVNVGTANTGGGTHFLDHFDKGEWRTLTIQETPKEVAQLVRNATHGKKVVAF